MVAGPIPRPRICIDNQYVPAPIHLLVELEHCPNASISIDCAVWFASPSIETIATCLSRELAVLRSSRIVRL